MTAVEPPAFPRATGWNITLFADMRGPTASDYSVFPNWQAPWVASSQDSESFLPQVTLRHPTEVVGSVSENPIIVRAVTFVSTNSLTFMAPPHIPWQVGLLHPSASLWCADPLNQRARSAGACRDTPACRWPAQRTRQYQCSRALTTYRSHGTPSPSVPAAERCSRPPHSQCGPD